MNKQTSSGMNFSGLLLLAFIVLKLCKVIAWSWWWVLSPIWIPGILLLIIYGIGKWLLKDEEQPTAWNDRMRKAREQQR